MAVYGYCDAKCEYEVYQKEEADEKFLAKDEASSYLAQEVDTVVNSKISALPSILSGTAAPTSSIGDNGDVYLMYG